MKPGRTGAFAIRWVVATILLVRGGLLACTDPVPGRKGAESEAASRPVEASPPNATRGHALLVAFRDSLPANSGNGLRCTSCHLDAGVRPNAMPWLGTAARYPRYRARRGSEETLEQRVNECIARSLAGKMLPEDGRDMRDMIAYLDSLGASPRPVGPDTVRLAGNLVHGKQTYLASCARCHGTTGDGLVAPAVYGPNSYSIGAGLARHTVFATFVRENMPFDSAGVLTPQQAADVATYVLSLPRPDHPGKERDWPKGDPPGDVAYATQAARAAGKPLPAPRPVLPRRLMPSATADQPAVSRSPEP